MGSPAVLAIKVVTDSRRGVKGLKDVETASQRFERRLGGATKVAGVAGVALFALGKKLEGAAEAAGTADARIGQVFKSMDVLGSKTSKAADRVVKSAERMARTTGIDPNTIKAGQAILGTFSELTKTADKVGGSFDRATQLAVDLSATGMGSVESASVLLGKALQDPIKGVSSLARVGVSLSESQKKQIADFTAAGKSAEAQNIILAAVEKQVGGVATATANSSDKSRVAWQLAQEQLGKKLAPAFEKARQTAVSLAGFVGSNTNTFVVLAAVVAGLAVGVFAVNAAYRVYQSTLLVINAIKSLSIILTTAQTVAQYALGTAWLAGRVAALGYAAGVRVLNAAMKANPIGLLITAITVVVGLFALAYKRSATFRSIVNSVGQAGRAAIGWIVDKAQALVSKLGKIGPAASKAKDVAVKAFDAYTYPIRKTIDLVKSLVSKIKGIKFPKVPKAISSLGGLLGGPGGPPDAPPVPPGGSSPGWGRGGTGGGGFSISAGGRTVAGGTTVNIYVEGAVDKMGVASQLEQMLIDLGIARGRPVVLN